MLFTVPVVVVKALCTVYLVTVCVGCGGAVKGAWGGCDAVVFNFRVSLNLISV